MAKHLPHPGGQFFLIHGFRPEDQIRRRQRRVTGERGQKGGVKSGEGVLPARIKVSPYPEFPAWILKRLEKV